MKRPVVVALLLVAGVPVAVAAYLYVGTATGFFEWRDVQQTTSFKVATAGRLGELTIRRLHARGVDSALVWSGACYGSVATVTACFSGKAGESCLAFEFDHHGTVLAGNQPALELFPELKPRGFPYGTSLDEMRLPTAGSHKSGA